MEEKKTNKPDRPAEVDAIMRKPGSLGEVDCCPEMDLDESCSRLAFAYRMNNRVVVTLNDRQRVPVDVQVILRAELVRCADTPVLGDIVYTTTLLPKERVRIFTHDRRSRFSYDSESGYSYRHEQSAEEHYFMGSMSRYLSDLTVNSSGSVSTESGGEWKGESDTPGLLGAIFGGADVEVGGSHNAHSNLEFANELRRHAESSVERSLEATRTSSSLSVGEVSTYHHAEGESESHLEATSRVFNNPNQCHAVTYLFYRINKRQRIRFRVTAIEYKVVDVAAPSAATNRPFGVMTKLAVLPDGVRAAAGDRIDVENRERESANLKLAGSPYTMAALPLLARVTPTTNTGQTAVPIDRKVRELAIAEVTKDLGDVGLVDKNGQITSETKKELSFEIQTSLPTPGVYVRGCIDECATCEPALLENIRLDLERKKLENKRLARQIELLDKAQEYRCCPEGETEQEDGE